MVFVELACAPFRQVYWWACQYTEQSGSYRGCVRLVEKRKAGKRKNKERTGKPEILSDISVKTLVFCRIGQDAVAVGKA